MQPRKRSLEQRHLGIYSTVCRRHVGYVHYRYLQRVPVKARKGTNAYRFSRFLTRNRAMVTATAILIVIVLTGTGMILREGYVAQRRFNDVRRLANSLIFEIHDFIKDLPGSTPARKLIVERATEYLDNLSKESRGDVSLQRDLATAFERVAEVQGQEGENSVGDMSGSLATFRKAFAIRQRLAAKTRDGADRLALARSFRLIADQEWALGDVSQARVDIQAAITISEELNQRNPNQWETLNELVWDYSSAGKIENGTYAWGDGDATKRAAWRRRAVEIDQAMLLIRPDEIRRGLFNF